MEPQYRGDPKQRRKDIRDDIERVVQIDGEKVLVVLRLEFGPFPQSQDLLILLGSPGPPMLEFRGQVTEEGGVPVLGLFMVHGLGGHGAFPCVMRGEVGEEGEDAETLVVGWVWDVGSGVHAMGSTAYAEVGPPFWDRGLQGCYYMEEEDG